LCFLYFVSSCLFGLGDRKIKVTTSTRSHTVNENTLFLTCNLDEKYDSKSLFHESGTGKQNDHPSLMISDTVKLWESEETGSHFMMFSFSRIKNATDHFSTGNKLGEGGFGPVYKVPYVLESGLFTWL
jgi:hypothetical protein